ncbi:IclR family transcriptional regulator [Pelobacter seleniigenes]|uniref:IclR family transcriptional regulator n=1 Tax=Pelobacter seleniigenes TaxID=407188 RepID=UPI0004A70A2D|nr:IclR family transcriptional regulator [Pelobacter seleniigenes]
MEQREKQPDKAPELVNTVVTTMAILECFNGQETELTLQQIGQRTGYFKSRVHRLCKTLIALGYLARTAQNNYRLGPKVMVLGKVYEKTNTLKAIATPIMAELSMRTQLSSTLYVLDRHRCICLARELGPSRFAYVINEGDVEELYTTAAGRVLMAYSPDSFAEKILAKAKPVRFTPTTITDPQKIMEELVFAREYGYAINDQEREQGISAISAPIFDHNNQIKASLAIVGLAHRFANDQLENLCHELTDATKQISYRLGEI